MEDSKPATEPPPYEVASNRTGKPPGPTLGPRLPLPLDIPFLNALRTKRVILASASPRRRQLLSQVGLNNLEIMPSPIPEHPHSPSPAKKPPNGESAIPCDSEKAALLQSQQQIQQSPIMQDPALLSADFGSLSPFEYVLHLATRKALAVYAAALNDSVKGDPALVIAADTVVVSHTGQILEKPRSEADHIAMLRTLSTPPPASSLPSAVPSSSFCEHKVYTGVVVVAPLASARDPGYDLQKHVEETTVKFGSDISDETLKAYVRTREGVDKAGGYAIQGTGGLLLVDRIAGSFDNVVGLPVRATLGLIEKVLLSAEDEDGEIENEDDEVDDTV